MFYRLRRIGLALAAFTLMGLPPIREMKRQAAYSADGLPDQPSVLASSSMNEGGANTRAIKPPSALRRNPRVAREPQPVVTPSTLPSGQNAIQSPAAPGIIEQPGLADPDRSPLAPAPTLDTPFSSEPENVRISLVSPGLPSFAAGVNDPGYTNSLPYPDAPGSWPGGGGSGPISFPVTPPAGPGNPPSGPEDPGTPDTPPILPPIIPPTDPPIVPPVQPPSQVPEPGALVWLGGAAAAALPLLRRRRSA